MGKKNKSSIPSRPTAQATPIVKAGIFSGLMAAVTQATETLALPPPAWSEERFHELHSALSDERRQTLGSLVNEFMELGKVVRKSTEAAETAKTEYETQLHRIEERRIEIEAREKALDERFAELDKQQAAILAKESALTTRERAMLARELNAEAGFAQQNSQALEVLNRQRAELLQQRITLEADITQMRTSLTEEMARAAAVQKERIETRQAQLDAKESQLLAKEQALELNQRQMVLDRRTAEQLETLLRRQIEAEVAKELAAKVDLINKLKRHIEVLSSEIDEINGRLNEFHDLEQALAGREPHELIQQCEDLAMQCRKHEATIRQLQQTRDKDDTSALRAERDRLDKELRSLQPELEDYKRQAFLARMGVQERENWEIEKRILQRSNELLSAGVKDLEARIKGLTDVQDNQGAFPELGRMDVESKFQIAPPTQRIEDLKGFTEELRERIAASQPKNPLFFPLAELQLFVGGLAMSQLHVLQGISGTGKTSLAKAFAKAVGGVCTDIAVQAGWRDRADLLGHYNAFEKRYYEKDCLQALYRARTPGFNDLLNVILLDEMNLSRPEQYFADFLSALEKEPDDRIVSLMESAPQQAPRLLREGREILVPENVWFIGTANQDESTNELADKTHDRAFVMELHKPHRGEVFQPRKDLGQAVYSYHSLKEAFTKAQRKHKKQVSELWDDLSNSELTDVLEKQFGLSWGNRLERQAQRFLPVVVAAGGSIDQALDHLLATRLFRAGKVTGRHDVFREDLVAMQKAVDATWQALFPNEVAVRCAEAIEKDIKRLERGG